MKLLYALIVALFCIHPAHADTINFSPVVGPCTGTACLPFVSDNPAYAISSITRSYDWSGLYVTLNGVTYSGIAPHTSTLITPAPNYKALWHYDAIVLSSQAGMRIVITLDAYYTRRLNRTGHNYYVYSWTVLAGVINTT